MKKAIFKKFFIIIIISSLICCFVSYGIISRMFYNNTVQNMIYSIKLIDHSIDYSKDLQQQIDTLNPITMTPDTRLTIVDKEGNVLADTHVNDVLSMENHITRDEISSALEKGYGDSVRKSETTNKKLLYVSFLSTKNSNYIIRLAVNFNGFDYFAVFIPAIILSVLIAVVISSILANKFSKSITDPLLEISVELNKIQENNTDFYFHQYDYDELNQIVVTTAKLANTINNTMSKLKQERNKIDYILNNMIEGFLLLDNNQNVLSINNSAKKMLECKDVVLGQNITRFTQKLQLLNAIDDATNKQKHTIFDLKLDDDKIYSVHITTVQKNIFSSTFGGVAILIVDVTSDRNARQMRQEFFSNVSHELKTPITSIQGFAELLETGIVTDEKTTKEFLSKIKKETQNMTNLINDILMISKLESRVNEVTFSNVKVKPIIEDIISTHSSLAQLRNIQINLYCEDIVFYANLQQLQQLFNNLIGNAVKYNVDNGQVFIGCYTEKNNLIFNIKDTGIGIPKYAQERVFERFYRVDKGRSKKMGGTGLGLSIVKHIVNFYNGQINLKSEIDKGTEITITLPENNKSNTI